MIDWNDYPYVKEMLRQLEAEVRVEEAKFRERETCILARGYTNKRELLNEAWDRFQETIQPHRAHAAHLVQKIVEVELMKPLNIIVLTDAPKLTHP